MITLNGSDTPPLGFSQENMGETPMPLYTSSTTGGRPWDQEHGRDAHATPDTARAPNCIRHRPPARRFGVARASLRVPPVG